MSVPVLLIGFNRPDLAEITLRRIIEAKPSKIYFAVDGPRLVKPGEQNKVEQVKNLITLIPKTIPFEVKFSESNHGCREGVTSAISWFFSNEELGIILEDDCLPDFSFFPFCETLLMKYKDDHKIGMISGDNFFQNKIHLEDSYFFSKYFHIWGWATWRRAWLGYQSTGIDSEVVTEVVKRNLKNRRARKFWIKWITESANGQVDTWDHQWTFHNWNCNRISIMPNVNLIANLGFRNDGTHTLDEGSQFANLKAESIKFPLLHPKKVVIKNFLHSFVEVFFYPSILRSIYLKVRIVIFNLIKK